MKRYKHPIHWLVFENETISYHALCDDSISDENLEGSEYFLNKYAEADRVNCTNCKAVYPLELLKWMDI